jgi:putative DNA methylase
MNVRTRKKLIEVALPLDAINFASAREKSIRHGHPSTLHLWWARRPLAAARAVIFAQMVDDPSSHPEKFPTEEAQEKERQRLFRLIEELVKWENTNNEDVLSQARDEIRKSWRSTCADNKDHPRAEELFNPDKLPAFHDPFAGGGALPLEAQRLGLEAHASDLNPVAVLICKAMIEIPPKFSGRPPVNPKARSERRLLSKQWRGAEGLAEDVRYYGQWMRDEAEKRIGHFYPKVEVTPEMAKDRPDLKPYVGRKLTVIAWLWARTVKSPNPAFRDIDVPLASTFMLSAKTGKEAYVEPVIERGEYRFTVKVGKPKDALATKFGTKLTRANFVCLMSGAPITGNYIKLQGDSGQLGTRMMAIIAEGDRGRVFLPPSAEMEAEARRAKPEWSPDLPICGSTQYIGVKPYGMDHFGALFTPRQLVTLTTFSDLVLEARDRVKDDEMVIGLPDESTALVNGGTGAVAYSDAVGTYLGLGVGRSANYWSTQTPWGGEFIVQTFGRQAIQMVWDHAEGNPFSSSTGNWTAALAWIEKVLGGALPASEKGAAEQRDAQTQTVSRNKVISTDPPYYDNVPYADLSDFFYVWLRRALRPVFPNLFATLAVPKDEELVAFAYRHDGKAGAETFFLGGMTEAMHRLAEQGHPAFPVTIYYAFKQSESQDDEGTASTGWETFLDAVIIAGFAVTGTWPVRTERSGGFRNKERNSLASSVILVCRKRAVAASTATRREFVAALKAELPQALAHLQRSNIAPVDLAQAAIGPGMAVYTRYEKVLDAAGRPLTVRDALALINQTLDEVLAEQEGDFDADTRFAVAWFDEFGFSVGQFGRADDLARAKNTSVGGLETAGLFVAKGGKARLLKPDELPEDWDPESDPRLTVWEIVHHLIRQLAKGGETGAAELARKLGGRAEAGRELAYRLYTLCERKKRAQEALAYNGLVQSWPEITRLARSVPRPAQTTMFERTEG